MASSRRSPGGRARRALQAPSARGTGWRRSCRVTASSRRTGSAPSARSVSSTSGGCSRSSVSLSDDLRDELAAVAPRRRCCCLAQLSALLHAAGSWHLRGRGELSVELDLGSSAVARRAFALQRGFGVAAEIRTYRRGAFDRPTRYQLRVDIDEATAAVLHEAGVLSARGAPLERPPKQVVGRSCCRDSYLRGALLGAGSLTGPRDAHLEIRASGQAAADLLADVAARRGIPLRTLERRGHVFVYSKSAETIADLLAVTGASGTALRLDEHAVVAATRAEANRLANADEANVRRTVDAAREQL